MLPGERTSSSQSDPAASPRLFLGVDGGGSSTRALLASADGRILGLGRGGPSNPHHAGIEGTIEAIRHALHSAWQNAGTPPRALSGAFFGIAGISSFPAKDPIVRGLAEMQQLGPEHIGIDHDLRIAHAGALAGEPGIVLVVGTGSAGYGRNSAGETYQAGGWGAVLDDVGSGYWLALHACQAVLRAHDGRGAATLLTQEVLGFLGIKAPPEIVGLISSGTVDRAQLATLAPRVLATAAAGDATAQEIVAKGALELALIARAIASKLFAGKIAPLALCGGLSSRSEYRAALHQALTFHAGNLALSPTRHAPVVGALILALQAAGENANNTLLAAADAALRQAI